MVISIITWSLFNRPVLDEKSADLPRFEPDPNLKYQKSRRFATTQWSVVLSAGRRSSPDSQQALETLCSTYWYPLYASVRSQGYRPQDAQDLTQEFFARLLARNDISAADRAKGRFRSFLSTALKHFLSNARDHARARKRRAGRVPISLDFATAESRLSLEPVLAYTAEKAFARRWALTLLDRVLCRLREEFVATGKHQVFDLLKDFLSGQTKVVSYAEVGADLKMTAGTVKVAVHRLRRRYRDLLRGEIAQTVANHDEVDDEIRELFAALGP